MQLQGEITAIQSTGGYQTPNGYIYTFDMGIQTLQGAYCGQIGSKTEVYPANIGDQIIVEATQDQYGTKFKKVNPKFAKQQQVSPQTQPPRRPMPQTQVTPKSNGNGHSGGNGELIRCRGIALSYCLSENQLNMEYDANTLATANEIAQWMMDGVVPNIARQPQGKTSQPDGGDDIPF